MKDLSKWCGLTGAKQGKYETQTYSKHYDVIIFCLKQCLAYSLLLFRNL